MNVNVVHGRNQQFARVVHHFCVWPTQAVAVGCHTTDATVVAYSHITVFDYFKAVFLFGIEDVCTINLFHFSVFISKHTCKISFFISEIKHFHTKNSYNPVSHGLST